eukprot:TRINITY_DN480_c0_g2_i1.p1 TRINITY_DN480_c0_g2~~TRINITY_DN480_c0_g2_i1.p1  ORF type:complete len:173 (-),score=35.55 TRINITY_DN480_c0_g2_i1:85-603(-)
MAKFCARSILFLLALLILRLLCSKRFSHRYYLTFYCFILVDQNQVTGPPGCNLFVFNLPPEFTKDQLSDLFIPYGNVVSSTIFIDKNTGMSKCFGFVSYGDPQQAQNAIQGMNGYELAGKALRVSLKRKDASFYPTSNNTNTEVEYGNQQYQQPQFQPQNPGFQAQPKRVRY